MSDSVTMREAQRRLGISKMKMWQLVRDGVLPTTPNPLDRREKLIRLSDLQRLMSNGQPLHRFLSDGIDRLPGPPSDQIKDWLRQVAQDHAPRC